MRLGAVHSARVRAALPWAARKKLAAHSPSAAPASDSRALITVSIQSNPSAGSGRTSGWRTTTRQPGVSPGAKIAAPRRSQLSPVLLHAGDGAVDRGSAPCAAVCEEAIAFRSPVG